jgi:hypothetical protein
MRTLAIAAVAGLAVSALAGVAVAFGVPNVPEPIDDQPGVLRWIIRPTTMDVTRIVEETSSAQGTAAVECEIGRDGRPGHCVVISEDPAGQNVGKLATHLAAAFKAASKDSDGKPTAGRRVRFSCRLGRSREL